MFFYLFIWTHLSNSFHHSSGIRKFSRGFPWCRLTGLHKFRHSSRMGGPISLRYRPLRSYPLQNIQHEVQTRCGDIWTNESCFSGLEGWCYILRVSPLPVCRKSKYLIWRRKADGIGEPFKRPYFLRTRPRHSFFVLLADDWFLFSLHEYVRCRTI